MASRYFYRDFGSLNPMMRMIEGQFVVDSTQTAIVANNKVSSIVGTGIANIANQAAGVYKITLTDRYLKFLGLDVSISSILGTQVAIASLSNGVPYTIKTLGTSAQADWVLAGMPAGVTAAVGVAFTAVTAASGSTGTGFAAPMITPGVTNVNVYGVPDTTLNPAVGTSPYLYIQALYTTTGPVTAPADPVNGTIIRFKLFFRDKDLSI